LDLKFLKSVMKGNYIDKLKTIQWILFYKINLIKLKYIGDKKIISHNSLYKKKIKIAETNDYIEKYIWSYWNDTDIPSEIINYVESNRKINSNFKYIVVNEINLYEYIPDFPKDINFPSVQHKADLIRLMLLNKFGGIWIDITTILTKSLEWIIEIQQKYKIEYVGYYNPNMMISDNSMPMIENWFMASTKNSLFIQNWLNEFLNALYSQNPRQYYQKDADFEKIRQNINTPFDRTFTMHLSAQKILHSNNAYSYYLINAEDDGLFFNYSSKNRVDYCSSLLIRNFTQLPPVIKITGGDRIKLNDFIRQKIYSKYSIFYKYGIINNRQN